MATKTPSQIAQEYESLKSQYAGYSAQELYLKYLCRLDSRLYSRQVANHCHIQGVHQTIQFHYRAVRLWRQQCQPLRILSRNEHQFPKKCHPSKNHLSSVLGLGDRLHHGVRKGVVGLHSLCKTDRACIRLHKQILHQQVE